MIEENLLLFVDVFSNVDRISNDIPFSTLIESNNESIDVNFVGGNNFGNNAYRCNFNPRPFPSNSSNNYGGSYKNSYGNYNNIPSDLENNIKDFINSQKIFNAMIKESFLKFDDVARNIDRISHEIDALKIRSMPPKLDINESLKSIQITINESRERTARMRAKREWLENMCSSSFCDNNDEGLKVIGVTPIEYLLLI